MESSSLTLSALFPANPSTKRATRVKWSYNPAGQRNLAYFTQKNVVIRNLDDPKASKVLSQNILEDISCVKYSPNGNLIAFGNVCGVVKVVGWSNAENNFIVKYESPLLGAPVNDIAWTDDNQKIIVVGDG